MGTGSGIFRTPGQQTVEGGEELGRMTFSRDDVYSLQLTDRDTGLTYRIAKEAATATAVSSANDTVTIANHGFITGDKITASLNDDLGVAGSPTRFVIKVDENTFKVASTLGNALNGTAIDIAGAGGTATAPKITGVGLTLNRSDENSKADFVTRINKGLKESASNSTITGNSNSRCRCNNIQCVFCR